MSCRACSRCWSATGKALYLRRSSVRSTFVRSSPREQYLTDRPPLTAAHRRLLIPTSHLIGRGEGLNRDRQVRLPPGKGRCPQDQPLSRQPRKLYLKTTRPNLDKPSVRRHPPHNHPPSQTRSSATRPPTAVAHSAATHAAMAPPAVNTLSVDWFDHLPSTYRSLYLARRGGGGTPDGQPAGAPPRWPHVATRGPALIPGDLPRVHAEHPPANHHPAACPAAATTPSTTDADAHRTRLMQLEALASMEAVVLARAAAQDVLSKDNAFKAGATLRRLAEDDVKVVAHGWSGGAVGGIDGVPHPVGATRDIRRPRKNSLKGINVVKGGLCGVNPKDKKVILAVVCKAVVDHFFIGRSFCRQSSGDVAKAAADVETACPTLARTQRSRGPCALLVRAVRDRNIPPRIRLRGSGPKEGEGSRRTLTQHDTCSRTYLRVHSRRYAVASSLRATSNSRRERDSARSRGGRRR